MRFIFYGFEMEIIVTFVPRYVSVPGFPFCRERRRNVR